MRARRWLRAATAGALGTAGFSLAQLTQALAGVPASALVVVAQALVIIVQAATFIAVLHLAFGGASR